MNTEKFKSFMGKGAIWGFILLELIFFSIAGEFMSLSDKAFMDWDNMLLLFKQSAPIGIIALGMTVIMINGNIDLSVGATFALCAVVMLDSMTWEIFAGLGDWVIPVAWALALITGMVLGLINGLIVWKTGVDAFIVTLGSMLGFRGLVFMYNGENPTSHLNWTLVDMAEADIFGIQTPTIILLVCTVLIWLLMTRTVHGRNAYAVGDNREAAVNAGIRVGPHMVWNFVLIGFLAALSSVVFYSSSGSVNPNDGTLYELWVITAVVLGGTKLAGGSGSVISTLGGVLAIQLLRKGLGHIGADTAMVNLVIGLILIAVLFLDQQLNRKGKQELKSMMIPALRLKDIVKTFPGVRALDGVSFEVLPGEVHALLGENGAGKSTLMKVLGGIYQPNEGQIFIEEQPARMASPLDAKSKGVVFIHQELSLADELTVAENIYLGALPRKSFGRVDWAMLYEKSGAILERLNCGFTPQTRVGSLSIANKQMVEIARALTVEAKAVIFDEPTASLTDSEKVVLFDIINDLRGQGVGVVYISHRMDEIFTISDRISVLRDGSYRGSLITADTNEDEVTQLMIGRSLDLTHAIIPNQLGEVALSVEGLSCGSLFQDVSFQVRAGEVVGFYGLVGAGRTEIAETLFGLRTASAGQIRISGDVVRINSPIDAISHGISLVPEDRKEQGLILGMNCRDNMTLPQVGDLTNGPFVSNSQEIAIFDTYHEKLEIKTPSWKQQAGNLSGGNQQKIVIGKWLSMAPKVLIVDEPTRGIDVGSKSEIHTLIRDLAAQGYAIIVISSEMPEVLRVSDRVIAMFHGRIMREFSAAEVTEDSLVQAISGINPDKVA